MFREPFEDEWIRHSSFIVAKPQIQPMDLVALELPSSSMYCFLSVSWGMFSDIDVDTEPWRKIGDIRFLLGAFLKIGGLKKYRGRLSYLPLEEVESTSTSKGSDNKGGGGDQRGPNQSNKDESNTITYDKNKAIDDQNEHIVKEEDIGAKEAVSSPSDTGISLNDDVVLCDAGDTPHRMIPLDLLPAIDQPVPSSWKSYEFETYSFSALFQTHLNQMTYGIPHASLDDGIIHIFYIKTSGNRLHMLDILKEISVDNGTYLENPHIEYIKCQAFRLEPLTKKGYLCVDGELVDYGPVQGQVMPSICNVIGGYKETNNM
ncbi:unnamed protein product [Owenia fusiformis]|uniref:YegS/DAGK C-terminal domain-containing protein n=1 Tax=Owenia fusiformis TaxID=6347 RepID=A0A8S4PM29_OWEFU|nr:unnamed protein product [Owenia fusiformis]